jgi:hypothetical protein
MLRFCRASLEGDVTQPIKEPAFAFMARDSESALAFGGRLSVSCADLWSLQLISGISEAIGADLIARKGEILAASKNGSASEALQLARGIGKTQGARLQSYLSFHSECEASDIE